MRAIRYPFVPKSSSYLRPGQFWAIPLKRGFFACGRVLQLGTIADPSDRRTFLAGLMDWVGSESPSSEAIAGCHVVEQGAAHIVTIRETGGAILGYRPLELDGIEPRLFRSAEGGAYCMVMRGLEILRAATPHDVAVLPVFSTWGYKVIEILAEKRFG